MAQSVDIFSYLDYRAFLGDYYRAEKARHPGFSFRAFSKRAGCRSPNYLKLVADGKRNLTGRMAACFAEACGLQGDKAAYFQDLVAFNQADTTRERNIHYRSLATHRAYHKAHRLDAKLAAYHENWYIPAVRELVASASFREDPQWIASQVLPAISIKEATQALATLVELEMLVRDDTGRLRQADPLVTTGPEVRSLHIANYHRAMTERAMDSIDRLAPEERDISSLTLCLSRNGLRRCKARLRHFREELLALSDLEENPEQVVQINFQLFPLSRMERADDEKVNKDPQ